MGATAGNKKKMDHEYHIHSEQNSFISKRDHHLLRLLKIRSWRKSFVWSKQIAELYYNLYNPSATEPNSAPLRNYIDVILTP